MANLADMNNSPSLPEPPPSDTTGQHSAPAHNVKTPVLLWAQRRDRLLITVALSDPCDPQVSISPTHLSVACATPAGERYRTCIELLREVEPEKSHWVATPRGIQLSILKKAVSSGSPRCERAKHYWWERLQKQEGKPWCV